MAKTVLLSIFLLLPFFSHAQVQDFCVADLTKSVTPSGYPCRANVSAEDFYYDGLATPGKYIKPFGFASQPAFIDKVPGMNGHGISAERLDFAIGGVVPLVTNVDTSEIMFVMEGFLAVGFISSMSNTMYTKTLLQGDIFVVPPNLLYFIYNVGKTKAVVLALYNNQNPVFQITDYALFANILPAAVVKKVTFLDISQVKNLKTLFGITSFA